MATGDWYLNTSGSDVKQTGAEAAVKAWKSAGGRHHTGYLVKVEIRTGVKKTVVGVPGGN